MNLNAEEKCESFTARSLPSSLLPQFIKLSEGSRIEINSHTEAVRNFLHPNIDSFSWKYSRRSLARHMLLSSMRVSETTLCIHSIEV